MINNLSNTLECVSPLEFVGNLKTQIWCEFTWNSALCVAKSGFEMTRIYSIAATLTKYIHIDLVPQESNSSKREKRNKEKNFHLSKLMKKQKKKSNKSYSFLEKQFQMNHTKEYLSGLTSCEGSMLKKHDNNRTIYVIEVKSSCTLKKRFDSSRIWSTCTSARRVKNSRALW